MSDRNQEPEVVASSGSADTACGTVTVATGSAMPDAASYLSYPRSSGTVPISAPGVGPSHDVAQAAWAADLVTVYERLDSLTCRISCVQADISSNTSPSTERNDRSATKVRRPGEEDEHRSSATQSPGTLGVRKTRTSSTEDIPGALAADKVILAEGALSHFWDSEISADSAAAMYAEESKCTIHARLDRRDPAIRKQVIEQLDSTHGGFGRSSRKWRPRPGSSRASPLLSGVPPTPSSRQVPAPLPNHRTWKVWGYLDAEPHEAADLEVETDHPAKTADGGEGSVYDREVELYLRVLLPETYTQCASLIGFTRSSLAHPLRADEPRRRILQRGPDDADSLTTFKSTKKREGAFYTRTV
ncbi:uncharacterized protein B0H18DRAFT_1126941 [Fomitopsis serialis]|uniref:uncharacterized protein n=1 Tax=Fomitopsis serialis TaxID=139415 RepID=UPI002007BEC8|nr:uncharacterized protein B0H18DRAFT_1126941 [Neoantrodia serialis]KAH9912658.1 hypothetical protein B0H18DRAFT_1126941 [Neoantrodia serialis]